MAVATHIIRPQDFMQKCLAFSTSLPRVLMGSRGEAVRMWQTLLQKQGAPKVQADGLFGATTQAATMAFQRQKGLPPDGIVGPKTWAAGLVAPCYAAALEAQRNPRASEQALMKLRDQVQKMRAEASRTAAHGVGALDLSFSVVDPKSMVLGVVLGIAAGAMLFRKKAA